VVAPGAPGRTVTGRARANSLPLRRSVRWVNDES